jgi:hypothetical protein
VLILSSIILKSRVLFILYSNEGQGSSWQINHAYKEKAEARAIEKAKVKVKAKVELKKALHQIKEQHRPAATVKVSSTSIVEPRPRPQASTASSTSPASRTHPSKGASVKRHKGVIEFPTCAETMRQIQRLLADNHKILNVTCVPNKVHY